VADLGSLLLGAQAPTAIPQQPAGAPIGPAPAPAAQSEWDSFLSDPRNRAGLLGFGLQMMMGGWGNNVASSLGAGIESYAGAEKLQYDQALNERTRQDQLAERQRQSSEAELDRQNRKDIAGMYTQSRETVAGMRQSRSPSQLAAYTAAYRSSMDASQIPILSGQMSLEEAEAQARAAAEAASMSAQSVGAAGGFQANSGGTPAPGGVPPPAQTAASGVPTGVQGSGPSYSDLVARYGQAQVDAALADPQKRAQIEARVGKIQGLPPSKGGTIPSFAGVAKPDGSKAAPFASAAEAGFGKHFIGADGKIKLKTLFGEMDAP
jgi:hypothetical protein